MPGRSARGSNLGGNARYDQILYPPSTDDTSGAVDFDIDDAQIGELFPGKNCTREKFTYQMSDHMPVGIQVKTDIEGMRLDQIIQESK